MSYLRYVVILNPDSNEEYVDDEVYHDVTHAARFVDFLASQEIEAEIFLISQSVDSMTGK